MASTPAIVAPGFRLPSPSPPPPLFPARIAPPAPPLRILSAPPPLRPRPLPSPSRSRKLRPMAASGDPPQPEKKGEGFGQSVAASAEPKYIDIVATQKILWFVEAAARTIPVVTTNLNRRLFCFKQRIDPDSVIWRGLKFTLLTAFLVFQASHDAVAGTEFAPMNSVPFIGDLGDITTGFASAFLLIFFSELGDKTFFIAALLAARNSGTIVFIGTFAALAAMSVVSVLFGRTFHYLDGILPFRFGEMDFPIDDFAAACLLVYFGVTTLLEASSDDEQKSKEEQKEAELVVSEFSGDGAGIMAAASTVVSTFILVFVAEWGDKSFFSTIALAAASSPLGVVAGALAGHALATLLAVIGGSLLGNFLSEKVIAYIGGILFLLFAMVTLVEIFN